MDATSLLLTQFDTSFLPYFYSIEEVPGDLKKEKIEGVEA